MTHYTEANVLLRFRSDQPLSYDDVRHRLQLCGMADLAEYVVVDWPKPITGGWTTMWQLMDAQAKIFTALSGTTRPRPDDLAEDKRTFCA